MKKRLMLLALFAINMIGYAQQFTVLPPSQSQIMDDTIIAPFSLSSWPNGLTKVVGEAYNTNLGLYHFSDTANVPVNSGVANGAVIIDTTIGNTTYQIRFRYSINGGPWVLHPITVTVTTDPPPGPLDIFEPVIATPSTYGFTVTVTGNSVGYVTNPLLYYRQVGTNTFSTQAIPPVTGSNFSQQATVGSLTPATSYEYFVTGAGPQGQYDQTQMYTVTTLPIAYANFDYNPVPYVDATESYIWTQTHITQGSSGTTTYWYQLLDANMQIVAASPQMVTTTTGYTPTYYFFGQMPNTFRYVRGILQDGPHLDTTLTVSIVTDQIPLPTIMIDSIPSGTVTKHTAIAWLTVNPGSTFVGSTTTVTSSLTPNATVPAPFTTSTPIQTSAQATNMDAGTIYTWTFTATNAAGSVSTTWTFQTKPPFPAVQFTAQPTCVPQTNSLVINGLTAYSSSWTGGNEGYLYLTVDNQTPVLLDSTTANLSSFSRTVSGLNPDTDYLLTFTWVNPDSVISTRTLQCHTLIPQDPAFGVYINDNFGYVDSASVVLTFAGDAGGYAFTNVRAYVIKVVGGVTIDTIPLPDQGPGQFSVSANLPTLMGNTQYRVQMSFTRLGTLYGPYSDLFCTYGAPTGLNELPTQGIEIFPSPATVGSDMMLRGLVKGNTYTVTFFDAMGALKANLTLRGESDVHIPVPNLPSGTYFLMLNDGIQKTQKRIVIN